MRFLYFLLRGRSYRGGITIDTSTKRTRKRTISFGTWRFFLACLVVLSHLWAGMIDGYAAYAVWGFFVLSGYLMTYVLKNKYGFNVKGLTAYAYNRFLRIMPSYWIAVLLGVITIVTLSSKGIELQKLTPQFVMPHGEEWLFSLTLIPIFIVDNLAVPVSTALGIEWGVYFLLPFMARHVSAAWISFLLGIFINYHYGINMSTFPARYSEFLPCLLPFAAGSLVAHYIDVLRKFSAPKLSWFVWIIHGLVWFIFDLWPWTYGLYFSIMLSAWVIISMDCDDSSDIDKILGDLSYPVYLFHTTVGAWFISIYGYSRPFVFFAMSFIGTLMISFIIIKFIDKPILRRKKAPIIQVKKAA